MFLPVLVLSNVFGCALALSSVVGVLSHFFNFIDTGDSSLFATAHRKHNVLKTHVSYWRVQLKMFVIYSKMSGYQTWIYARHVNDKIFNSKLVCVQAKCFRDWIYNCRNVMARETVRCPERLRTVAERQDTGLRNFTILLHDKFPY